MNDTEFMQIAIEESKNGDWPYGAVIVKDGAIVAKGFNTATRDRDPTAHAEVNVIRAALKAIPDLSLKGYTLYTSSESCPMCTGAIVWAGVSRVVFGASIQQLIDVGQPQINTSCGALIKTAFINVELTGGVLAAEALKVVRDWRK
jgi:tRNA(adenine34) deaminase